MDLWTEFEGHTIDSAFSLKKLLQTEGRSAFFSTLNEKGESVLIRIVECHFDEDEILARWRGVQVLNHPNFLRIDRYGQFLIEADEITAVYVVFERVDANLGQVLEKGRLSAADAAQIGLSITSALQLLHDSGFVHEHLEPGNIFAVGESVKLRSDCVRETPEGVRGFEARRRDVHDLAVVLEQVLTGMVRGFPTTGHSRLPAPFEEIVCKGMSGEWGLAEIAAALEPHRSTKPVAAPRPPAVPELAPQAVRAAAQAAPIVTVVSAHTKPIPAEAPAGAHDVSGKPFVHEPVPGHARLGRPPETASTFGDERPLRWRASFLIDEWRDRLAGSRPRWIAAVAMLLVIVLCGWAFTHHLLKAHAAVAAQAASTTRTAHSAPAARSARTAFAARPARPQAASFSQAPVAAPSHGEQWRVIAFTYRHQEQAQKKAASLGQKLPGLRPEAFSPNGRGPWLVTIGGPLQRDAAYALAQRARSLGLPHDTYAQNYKVR